MVGSGRGNRKPSQAHQLQSRRLCTLECRGGFPLPSIYIGTLTQPDNHPFAVPWRSPSTYRACVTLIYPASNTTVWPFLAAMEFRIFSFEASLGDATVPPPASPVAPSRNDTGIPREPTLTDSGFQMRFFPRIFSRVPSLRPSPGSRRSPRDPAPSHFSSFFAWKSLEKEFSLLLLDFDTPPSLGDILRCLFIAPAALVKVVHVGFR